MVILFQPAFMLHKELLLIDFTAYNNNEHNWQVNTISCQLSGRIRNNKSMSPEHESTIGDSMIQQTGGQMTSHYRKGDHSPSNKFDHTVDSLSLMNTNAFYFL